jgi:CRP-like cAMP-binding protein
MHGQLEARSWTTQGPLIGDTVIAPRVQVRSASPAVFLRRIEGIRTLTEPERALIGRLGVFRESIQAGRHFWRPGHPVAARVIISGWACRQRTLPDGRRQIFGFLLPGDTVGLTVSPSPLDELSTVAINRVESMDALMLREILHLGDTRYASLQAAIAETRRLEETYLLNHIVRLGRQSAFERMAHLILEVRERTKMAGLAQGDRFPMPLTQEVLSDVLGLSIVHVNRTLQQLKRDGLIEMKSGWVCVLDARRLETIADYGSHDD